MRRRRSNKVPAAVKGQVLAARALEAEAGSTPVPNPRGAMNQIRRDVRASRSESTQARPRIVRQADSQPTRRPTRQFSLAVGDAVVLTRKPEFGVGLVMAIDPSTGYLQVIWPQGSAPWPPSVYIPPSRLRSVTEDPDLDPDLE